MVDTANSGPVSAPDAVTTTDSTVKDDKWSSQMYSKHASFVPALGAPVVQLLDPQSHERILDLGAGDALHWMKKDPVRVIQGVHKCLKPGGRFVAECGGYMNVAEVRTGLHWALRKRGYNPDEYDPWFFPGVKTYRKMLEEQGFKVESIELIPRLTKLNTDVAGWIATFGFAFLKPFENDEVERQAVIDEVQANLPFSEDDGVWHIMYQRLRFKAVKV
ncbi:hypothetical protein BGX23_006305 [Mortierella sp. AD031]|nr:hypothetical protein BGX23_006305 [Mortierella sp. AD031]